MHFNSGRSCQIGLSSISMRLQLIILLTGTIAVDAMAFSVELRLPRYVPQGGSALLRCDYNVRKEELHKVDWLRGHNKLLEYVKDRNPPFIHYKVVGAVIDRNGSNERQIMLRNLDLDATGYYSCEVATNTPIFTKLSNEEELTVIQPQQSAPEVTLRKPLYTVGELLEANCSSSPAHPVPHITWLVNGASVSESYLRFFPNQHLLNGGRLSSATVQLSMPIDYEHVLDDGHMQLRCVATIPAFLGPDTEASEYADYQMQETAVEVVIPEVPKDRGKMTTLTKSLFVVVLLVIIRNGYNGRR